MKITIFSDNVAPYRIGWADEMGKTNDVTFVYTKDKDRVRNDSWLVKSSRFAKMVKLPAVVIKNRAITLNVIKYLKKNPSDIIIFDGYGPIPNMLGILYLRFKKARYFINIDGVDIGAKKNVLRNMLKKLLFGPNAYFLCGSEYTQNWLKTFGIPEERTISHNFSSIHENELLKEVPTLEERDKMKLLLSLKKVPTVIAVGRFLKLKQFDMLIEAFSSLDSEYQLLIIGEGTEKSQYENLIKDYSLNNVRILDFMSFDELKKYYIASDLIVLPSNSEIWGLVINEAMACGALPVIASDRCVAGYSLIAEEKNGYLFPYNDKEDLRFKMQKILENEKIRYGMSKESLCLVRNYTIEYTAKIHLEWFKKFLDN